MVWRSGTRLCVSVHRLLRMAAYLYDGFGADVSSYSLPVSLVQAERLYEASMLVGSPRLARLGDRVLLARLVIRERAGGSDEVHVVG